MCVWDLWRYVWTSELWQGIEKHQTVNTEQLPGTLRYDDWEGNLAVSGKWWMYFSLTTDYLSTNMKHNMQRFIDHGIISNSKILAMTQILTAACLNTRREIYTTWPTRGLVPRSLGNSMKWFLRCSVTQKTIGKSVHPLCSLLWKRKILHLVNFLLNELQERYSKNYWERLPHGGCVRRWEREWWHISLCILFYSQFDFGIM